MSALLIGGIPRRDIQARRRVHCSGYFQGTGGLFVCLCVCACVRVVAYVGRLELQVYFTVHVSLLAHGRPSS